MLDVFHTRAELKSPTDLGAAAVKHVPPALKNLLADVFALYLKTKNFHWHMSGPHFRDYHLLLDEQGDQIFATTDAIAERVRKIGGTTLHSIGHIGRLQRVADNDSDFVTAMDMLAELRDDNKQLVANLRETHGFATSTAMLPPQACWKSGSMRLSGAHGSCSRPHGGLSPKAAYRKGISERLCLGHLRIGLIP